MTRILADSVAPSGCDRVHLVGPITGAATKSAAPDPGLRLPPRHGASPLAGEEALHRDFMHHSPPPRVNPPGADWSLDRPITSSSLAGNRERMFTVLADPPYLVIGHATSPVAPRPDRARRQRVFPTRGLRNMHGSGLFETA